MFVCPGRSVTLTNRPDWASSRYSTIPESVKDSMSHTYRSCSTAKAAQNTRSLVSCSTLVIALANATRTVARRSYWLEGCARASPKADRNRQIYNASRNRFFFGPFMVGLTASVADEDAAGRAKQEVARDAAKSPFG